MDDDKSEIKSSVMYMKSLMACTLAGRPVEQLGIEKLKRFKKSLKNVTAL